MDGCGPCQKKGATHFRPLYLYISAASVVKKEKKIQGTERKKWPRVGGVFYALI